jgi:hypothetical protein
MMMIFSLIITIAIIAIYAVMANATDLDAKSLRKLGKAAFKLEGGAWISENADGSSTYMKFNDISETLAAQLLVQEVRKCSVMRLPLQWD